MTLSQYTSILLEKLHRLGLPEEEFKYRAKSIRQAEHNETASINGISMRYYNLAHEVKCLDFLQQFGRVVPALDYKHTCGCNAILNSNYQVEFVCTSPGNNLEESGFNRFSVQKHRNLVLFDYPEKERFLFSRITSALQEKRAFYEKHLKKKAIIPEKPYIIFIGLGSLAIEMFAGEYGIELNSVLLGKGEPTITLDGTGKVVETGYSHHESFRKYNNAELDCNLFCREQFRCVSGIIFSEALLYDDYTASNTWMFLNPYASVKIQESDFPNIIFWSANGKGEYCPRCNGEYL